jgi:Ca2+/Na+ antiporter
MTTQDETSTTTENNNVAQAPLAKEPSSDKKGTVHWGVVVAGILILVLVIVGLIFLFKQDAQTTGQIRDVFIIFFALESLIIGAALIVLVVQLAVLINLLQNEIKPIIDSTNETVHTIKGTAVFLSDSLVQPVIKLNEYLAGLKKVADIFNPKK